MEFKNTTTYENLAKAFAGECQARTRYMFLSYAAKEQGLQEMAKVIDDVQHQEFTHARMFYTQLQQNTTQTIDNIKIAAGYPFKERWTLLDNLKFASENEQDEFNTIYPAFAKVATQEGYPEIEKLFTLISKVESCHHKLFSQLHINMENETLYKSQKPLKWKCGNCGHEASLTNAWQICPLCKAQQGFVMLHLSDS